MTLEDREKFSIRLHNRLFDNGGYNMPATTRFGTNSTVNSFPYSGDEALSHNLDEISKIIKQLLTPVHIQRPSAQSQNISQ